MVTRDLEGDPSMRPPQFLSSTTLEDQLLKLKLTDGLVKKLTENPPPKDTAYFDIELARFALRIWPRKSPPHTGALFYCRYTDPEGREQTHKIGSPSTLSVAEARKAARNFLGRVDTGRDPVAEKRIARQTLKLHDLASKYRSSRDWESKTPETRRSDDIRIDQHILHRLGSKTVAEIRAPVVQRFLDEIRTDQRVGKRGRQLGGNGTARKCARLLSTIISWAVAHGYAEAHPFRHSIRVEGDGMREAAITKPSDFKRLFLTMDQMVEAHEIPPCARAYFVLLALTGMRRGDAIRLNWKQIDLDTMMITLPTSKGSRLARSGIKTEMVAIPAFAAAILTALADSYPTSPDDMVFPPLRGIQLETSRLWTRIRDRAGLRGDLTGHGLRHSAGTIAALNGATMPEIQALLRHRQSSTTTRYIKFAEMARMRPADKLAANIFAEDTEG